MSQQAVMTMPLSRPKIHRLPAPAPRFSKKTASISVAIALAFGVAATGMAANKLISNISSGQVTAADVPEIMPITVSLTSPAQAESNANTIVLKDEKQTIVGQMAKIPSQNQQITEIKSVSNVDNSAGRELLSIVGKY